MTAEKDTSVKVPARLHARAVLIGKAADNSRDAVCFGLQPATTFFSELNAVP